MTKQEEIREVLDTLCAVAKAKDLTKSPTGFDEEVRNATLELHELGVVIKVDGELPKYWFDRGVDGYTNQHYIPSGLQEAIEGAGYVAVEPLIEEGK